MSKSALTILGLLAERPMHGYDIIQTMRERSMDKWLRISQASIYKTLNSLEGKGEVEATTQKVGKNPERNVYNLTEKGMESLRKLVEKFLCAYTYSDYPFGLGIAFLEHTDIEFAQNALSKRLEELNKIGSQLIVDREAHKKTIPFNWLALIQVGIDHWQAEINQLRFILDKLKKEKLDK